MAETMLRTSYSGGALGGGLDRPMSRTAPAEFRSLQPHDDDRDTRLSSLAGAHRPLRVCIYCNGDRHFKVMRNALLTTRLVFAGDMS